MIKSKKLSDKIFKDNSRLKYIIDFITDNNKYYEKFLLSSDQSSLFASKDTTVNTKVISQISQDNSIINIEDNNGLIEVNENEDDFSITKIIKRIPKGKNIYEEEPIQRLNSASFIKEMRNGDIIVGGPDNRLFIYDKDVNLKTNTTEESINQIAKDITSTKSGKSKANNKLNNINKNLIETDEKDQILLCSKYSIIFLQKKENNGIIIKMLKQYEKTCTNCFEIKIRNNVEHVIIGEKGLYHLNFCPPNKKEITNIFEDKTIAYKGGINLNNNFLALTSNSILPDGADLLVFYDIKNRKILDFQRKINFSFNIGVNGLNLMKLKDGKNILLCACKKYVSSQKNGILIIDPEIKGEEIYYKFYETEEFEVNCFCPLYIKEDNKRLNTNFFFVGGLDADQKSGLIKLFGVCKNSSEKIGYSIEFLQDITFEKTNEFNGSINCIIQLKTNGNILANCLDGNLFYLSEPNITYYLEELR